MDIRGFFAKPKGGSDVGKRKAESAEPDEPSAAPPKKPAPGPTTPASSTISPKEAAKVNISPADFFGLGGGGGRSAAATSKLAKTSIDAAKPAPVDPAPASGEGKKRKHPEEAPTGSSSAAAQSSPAANKSPKGEPASHGASDASNAPSGSAKAKPPRKDKPQDKPPQKPKATAHASPAAAASSAAAASPAAASPAAAPSAPALSGAVAAMAAEPVAPLPKKWFPGQKDDAPPNKGNKTVPVGAPDCLSGKTFVVTGTQDSLEREEVEALIKRYGGRVTGSVSGKTSYLMRGIDCSTGSPIESSKVNKAIGLKTKIIDEDGLFDMLRKTVPQPEPEPQPQPAPEPKPRQPPAAPASGAASGGASGAADARAPAVERAPALWAEKYRPQRVEDLVGNNDHVKRLVQWASTWEANARGGKEFRKAVLLSGPPGVGKTSAARVVLAALGYDVIELNASDTRSKNALQQTAADMLTNTSIAAFATGGGGGGGPAASSKLALIMDEVDGMSSGDRGGMQQLVALIKTSKLPVICCCNDRSSQKVKSLANHCLDLRFRKPSSREVATAFLKIATSEGYRTDLPSVEKVAVACNGDLRGMLNLLQLWRPSGETLNGDAVAKGATNDISAGAFEVWDRFFKQATRGSPAYKPLDGRLRDYFVDSSMTPLLVQEMYPSSPGLSMGNAPQAQLAALNRMASAAESIAESDVVGSRIVREQQWTLSPLQGVLACARPGFFAAGGITSQARFPAFLGRFSTANKRQRLLRECASHMQAQASASKAEVRCSYVPALRSALVRPLKTGGSDGIEATLALLDEYSLTKDDYDALVELQLALGDKKEGEDLPSAVKSALTRAYNKSHRTEPRKLGKASRAAEPSRFDEDGALDDDAEAEDEEEEAEPVAAKPKQKAAASKGKGKAKAR